MINLIPPNAKRNVVIEYVARTLLVAGVLLVCVLFVAAILMMPQIVLLRLQQAVVTEQHQASVSEQQTIDTYIAEIKDSNEKTAILYQAVGLEQLVPYLKHIQEYESPAISFSSIRLNRKEGKVSSIELSGLAKTRQALAKLKEDLVLDPLIQSVDLPLANLAKDKDVSFNMSVELVLNDKNI